jgi:hypothetical protein
MSHQQAAKHGPAVDDALTNARRQSSAGTHHRGRPEDDPTGQTLGDDLLLRSELARFLEPTAFPANIDTLRGLAHHHHATDTVLALLDRAPNDRSKFNTVEELWETVTR